MKKLILGLVAIFVAAVIGIGVLASKPADAAQLRFCNNSAVINCGIYSQSELNSRIKADARALFKHLGVSTDLSKAVAGKVYKDGRVTVNGKVVATGAKTVGRVKYSTSSSLNVSGTSTKFYLHPVKTSLPDGADLYVFLNADGTFKNAIAKACGNPITATNKVPKPSYKCTGLTVKELSRTKFEFAAAHSANNAKLTKTVYVVKDASGKVVSRSESKTFTRTTPGTYTVSAELTFSFNGKTATVTNNCVGKFTVKYPEIKVCELESGKIITIRENQFDGKKHSKDLSLCDKIRVCEISTGKIITISKYRYNSEKHSTDLTLCDEMEVCKISTGKIVTIRKSQFDDSKYSTDVTLCDDIEVCELATKQIITIKKSQLDSSKHSQDLDDCKEEPPVVPPVTPPAPELPKTGAGSVVALIASISTISSGIYYAVMRKRLA